MDFGQNIIIGISGTELTKEEEEFIIQNNIGGVVLFKRNLESPEQIWELNRNIQRLRFKQKDQAPLFVGVDMEGGRVHRLQEPFTNWPAQAYLGQLGSPTVAFKFAYCMGQELRAVGFNLNFSPCVDVLSNPDNPAIGDRSISKDPEEVAKIGSALVRGFIKGGVIPCAKHFPGHGNTVVDSHEELPVENLTLEELSATHLVPFKKVFKSRIDLVMTCHIQFPKIDELPATLSTKIIRELLMDESRFRGVIVTDDLDMGALTKNFSKEDIPVRALQAGCDILLYCNEPESPKIAVESVTKALEDGRLDKAEILERSKKVLALKKAKLKDFETLPLEDGLEIISNDLHKRLAASIREGSVEASLLE